MPSGFVVFEPPLCDLGERGHLPGGKVPVLLDVSLLRRQSQHGASGHAYVGAVGQGMSVLVGYVHLKAPKSRLFKLRSGGSYSECCRVDQTTVCIALSRYLSLYGPQAVGP
jgi:hypothetical protein